MSFLTLAHEPKIVRRVSFFMQGDHRDIQECKSVRNNVFITRAGMLQVGKLIE